MLNVQSIRVLDLTDLAGQFAGKILADLGFEVIKVEPPGGDAVRRLPPFRGGAPDADASLPFLYLNSNKKSITLDLEPEQGRVLLKGLARKCDILLESFPPGRLEQWGVGYQALAHENPGLVMTSITGFGQNGPYAAYRSSDLVALAMGGLLNVFGESDRPPCKPPETQAYYTASAYAALGALVALRHRQVTGRGQHVDVSMQEALAVIDQIISSAANEKLVMRREGAQHKQVSPANVFPCRDGYVYLFVSAGGGHWKQFLKLWPDHPAKFDDPEWESPGYRRLNTALINDAVREFTLRSGRDKFVERMQSNGIPCLPVNAPSEFLQDEQIQARGFVQSVSQPRWGCYRHPGAPYLLDGQRLPIRPAPSIGEHNAEIYGNLLGMDDRALAGMRAANVI